MKNSIKSIAKVQKKRPAHRAFFYRENIKTVVRISFHRFALANLTTISSWAPHGS